jgi:5-methylcytosine-specific restriction endonuclease McrA
MGAGSLAPVSRTITFAPGLAGATAGWAWLGQPLHWAGLGVMAAVSLVIWPMLVLALLFWLPALAAGGLVPRRWRIAYRHRHGREGAPSAYISARLRRVVYAADRRRCVACKSRIDLNVDHVRPWAGGGLTTLWNCMTLCGRCNRVKSNYWQDRDGYVHYRGYPGSADAHAAEQVLRRERRHRFWPLRWTRAAWALGS